MNTCVCIWGKSQAALDFFYRMQVGNQGLVFYAENWPESLSILEQQGGKGEVYALPDEAQCCELPRFFRKLSERSCYELKIQCADSSRWRLPESRMKTVEGVRFVCFSFRKMPLWQACIKRLFDILCSVLGLVLLSPLFLLCAILVKTGSKGPVFYWQERTGKNEKPFRIYKFRSMRTDAEQNVPRLSHKGDVRITAWGNVMRRYRLDELPQLYNTLKGDMSLVGYRPERDYFIARIEQQAPYYPLLFGVRPGISSAGITTFGYAEDVEQMVERLSCDMDYLQRLSLREDLRILGRTVRVVLYGIGK